MNVINGNNNWKSFAISILFALFMFGLTVYNGIMVSKVEAQARDLQSNTADIVAIRIALTDISANYLSEKYYIKKDLEDIKNRLVRIEERLNRGR